MCVCSLLIQGSGWSCCPRGRSLVKPTQFFHIRHCNCSCWPGCLRLGTPTYTLINTCSQTYACASTYVTQEPFRVYWWLLSSDVLCFYSLFLQPVDFVAACLFVITNDCCLLHKMSDSCICEPVFLNYNLVCIYLKWHWLECTCYICVYFDYDDADVWSFC